VIEPLRVEVVLDCSVEHAVATWTERFSSWWPRGHSVSGDPATVTLEPQVGGRIYERTRDGQEIDWGQITAWDPPHRLSYRWHLRRPSAEATDVEIRFVPVPGGRSKVDITHTGWEQLGADAGGWRDANAGGWRGLLPYFVAACNPTTEGER
jgi:uncharacterized protein YndB with AHSA1/START domain